MKKIAVVFAVVAFAALVGTSAGILARAQAEPAPVAVARSRVFHLVRHHQQFPATKAALVAAMRTTQEIDAGHERWLRDHLPDRTYHTAAEVLRALYSGAAPACSGLAVAR